jgi:prepilin-type N-terminal cleavage/methylation domain-containing protein
MKDMRKAFTLMELLVVVAILAVIAAFTIPNYNRSQARADERVAVSNMYILAEAMKLYRDRNGQYPPFPNESMSVPQINSVFNLHILEHNEILYTCGANEGGQPLGTTFECEAEHDDGWQIEMNTVAGRVGLVFCDNQGHPSCPTCNFNGCPF